ncbi:hypothetical protein PG994_003240 [Apiospora phragmitis]|uniref:Uncharacterized protein n=1 Tax=Apiospora phragmitis TaxID=2905665 RepID=A0ABR1VXK6_9PEZI
MAATTGIPTTAATAATATRGAGPLTTVFTMPDFCQQPWWTFRDAPAVSSSVCMPGNWVDYYGNRHGFYSPAICPQGYTEGCYLPASAARTSEGNGKPWNGGPILAGETARICCPAGYSCFEDTTTDDAVQWRKCITTAVDPLTTYATNLDGTTTVTTTTQAMAYAIQVRWQSSDLSVLETDPTVPGKTYTRTAGGGGESDGKDDGSNEGAPTTIIVVGVVVPVMSLILGIIAFLYWRHHYRTKYKRTGTEDNFNNNNNNDNNGSSMALSAHSEGFAGVPTHDEEEEMKQSAIALPREMDAAVVHEADPDARPWMELPASQRPALQEMPATTFVAELADTSVAPYRRADEISIATSNDIEGSTVRRKSLRDGGSGSMAHARKFSWAT